MYCFNFSLLAVAVMVTYVFCFTRKIICSVYLWLHFYFSLKICGCTIWGKFNKNPIVPTLFYLVWPHQKVLHPEKPYIQTAEHNQPVVADI